MLNPDARWTSRPQPTESRQYSKGNRTQQMKMLTYEPLILSR